MTKNEQWLLDEKYGGNETPEYEIDKERLARGEPLGYVIGHTPFLGLTIFLDSKPLIPRPETEWWTEQLLNTVKDGRKHSFLERTERNGASQSKFPAGNYAVPEMNVSGGLTFLDLCAGSGAIGCAALARLPQAQVYFGELDPAHEATILKNIRQNNLDESRATIGIGDLFEPFGNLQFDVIAANPPYIPNERIIPASVTDYEPSLALFAGADGLEVIRRIATTLPKHMKKDGVAWIECDSAHATTACALFTDLGLSAKIHTDQYGVERLLVVSFPS